MKNFYVLSFLCLCASLNADVIFLNSGSQIKGQVVLITKEYVIVEIPQSDGKTHINQSFNREDVKLIVNDWGETLYKDNRKVSGLESFYTREDEFGHTYRKRILNYPHVSILFGISKIHTGLSKLRDILIYEPEENYNIEQADIKNINNQYTAVHFGVLWQYNPYLAASLIAYWPRFGSQTSYDDDEQFFRMALAEIRLSYPLKYVMPWIGVGYASQSIKIIDRINEIDIKWSSHNMGFVLACGAELCLSDFLRPYIAYRDLLFLKKAAARTTTQKIDLSNQVVVGGVKLTF